jgi:hypothetical protein
VFDHLAGLATKPEQMPEVLDWIKKGLPQ